MWKIKCRSLIGCPILFYCTLILDLKLGEKNDGTVEDVFLWVLTAWWRFWEIFNSHSKFQNQRSRVPNLKNPSESDLIIWAIWYGSYDTVRNANGKMFWYNFYSKLFMFSVYFSYVWLELFHLCFHRDHMHQLIVHLRWDDHTPSFVCLVYSFYLCCAYPYSSCHHLYPCYKRIVVDYPLRWSIYLNYN